MSLPDRATLGTIHGKAAAIAPPPVELGIQAVVTDEFDADAFGTFRVSRPGMAARSMRHVTRLRRQSLPLACRYG